MGGLPLPMVGWVARRAGCGKMDGSEGGAASDKKSQGRGGHSPHSTSLLGENDLSSKFLPSPSEISLVEKLRQSRCGIASLPFTLAAPCHHLDCRFRAKDRSVKILNVCRFASWPWTWTARCSTAVGKSRKVTAGRFSRPSHATSRSSSLRDAGFIPPFRW